MVSHLVRYSQTSSAISESGGGLNFAESGVNFPELPAAALDGRTNVRSMAQLPITGHEALVVLNVVNLAVGQVATEVRRQEMDDVLLTEGEADISIVPVGPTVRRAENELVAHNEGVRLGRSCRLAGSDTSLRRLARTSTPRILSTKSSTPRSRASCSLAGSGWLVRNITCKFTPRRRSSGSRSIPETVGSFLSRTITSASSELSSASAFAKLRTEKPRHSSSLPTISR
jgi:hypothetical protein